MIKWKNVLELQLEDNSMPWQSLEGDNETWIILRKKISLAPLEIQEISGGSINSSDWTVAALSPEGVICKGSLDLTVNYKLQEHSLKVRVSDAMGVEENLLQDYLQKEMRLAAEKGRNEEEYSTTFSSLIIREPYKNGNSSGEELTVNLPWQARLCCMEEVPEPRVVLLHLFQEGISTILAEMLLKLESKKTTSPQRAENSQHYFPSEEGVAVISGDKIQEALALVTKRSFISIDCGAFGQVMRAKAIVRYALIYLSKNKGGPRIQIAACFKEEERVIKTSPLPLYQPALQRYGLLSSSLTKIDVQKAAYKNEVVLEIMNDPVCPEEKTPVLEKAALPKEPLIMNFKTRKRPGEKWLKKGKSKIPDLAKNKTVLCIRFK